MNALLLEAVCWDRDRIGKDYLGEFDVALEDIFVNGLITQEVHPQASYLNARLTRVAAVVHVMFKAEGSEEKRVTHLWRDSAPIYYSRSGKSICYSSRNIA